jgi:hypothetical protein
LGRFPSCNGSDYDDHDASARGSDLRIQLPTARSWQGRGGKAASGFYFVIFLEIRCEGGGEIKKVSSGRLRSAVITGPQLDSLRATGMPWLGLRWLVARVVAPSVIAGVGHLSLPGSLIAKIIVGSPRPGRRGWVGRRDLSRLLVGEVIGGVKRRCLARLLMPKRLEKILWGRRVLL